MERTLAPLNVGSELPYKLASDGTPQWLVVTRVLSESAYEVRYPDGTLEVLRDSE